MIKSEQDVIRAFAGEIADGISKKIIRALQKVTDTLSGDDSKLANAWGEICAQLQDEPSFYWEVYDDMAHSFVSDYVEKLKEHERFALWLQTDHGWDWLSADEDEKDEYLEAFDEDYIVEYIVQEHLYRKANSWSNRRLRDYLD